MDKYEIEFKVKGLVACNPDTFLTNEMKISETNSKDFSFSILIASEGETSEDAIDIASRKLNLYLDYYKLFFDYALEIHNDGKPFSVAKIIDEKVISESYSLSFDVGPLFIIVQEMKNFAIDILKLLSEPRNGYLRIAVDYNRRAGLEKNGEDEILHLFIALEALYSLDNEKQEIQHRFSNRISTLLGMDKDHRINVRTRTKKLYNLRSKIVHGSEIFEGENFNDLVEWTQESILRFLVLAKKYSTYKHENILDMIDNAMLDNSLRDKLREESKTLVQKLEQMKTTTKENKK